MKCSRLSTTFVGKRDFGHPGYDILEASKIIFDISENLVKINGKTIIVQVQIATANVPSGSKML